MWVHLTHVIMLYDTSGIADSDTIDSATFEFVVTTSVIDDFTEELALVLSTPASNTNLVNADYSQLGTARQTDADMDLGAITADNSTYNAMTLNATGRGNISKTSISKFGLVTSAYIDGEPTWASNQDSRPNNFVAADTTGTSTDPKLVIGHTSPATFTPRLMVI